MRLSKFFKIIGFVTVLAVIYIHMQMEIIDLAYQSNRKEQHIKKLIEQNGNANYKILMLKSANNLGEAMLDENSGMQFADSGDIITIASSEAIVDGHKAQEKSILAKSRSSLMSLLNFGVVAEAKTSE